MMLGVVDAKRFLARAVACAGALLFAFAAVDPAHAQNRAAAQANAGSGGDCQGGYVHEATGLVSIQRPAGKPAVAKAGDRFGSDTLIHTGPAEKTILKFADGQVIVLGPNSDLRIGRYCYIANSLAQSHSRLELLKGEMRVVTGLIGASHPEAIRIMAGDSMIALRKSGGTDFAVGVNPDPKEVGYTAVVQGELSVRTPYGPIYKVLPEQYAPWRPGGEPRPAIPLAAAPAVNQAEIAGLLASVLPNNAPVQLETAARAATVVASAEKAQAAADATRLAGFVQDVSSTVKMQSGANRSTTAIVGSTFSAGASFDTGANGRVVLKFADGQIVVLGPASRLNVGDYSFDAADLKSSRSTLDLVNGAMRYISGVIHSENQTGISISAGASIVDILSAGPADFTVAVDTRRQEVGVARVTLGEISAHTPYGPIDKIKADQSSLWGPKTATTPVPIATGLAVVQAAVALQLSGLPQNTPTSVLTAALAASAQAEAKQAESAALANPQNAQLQATAAAAAEIASTAAKTAEAAYEAIQAKLVAATVETLAPTAAGVALAQAPTAQPALPPPPVVATVTPGAAGGCTGSPCQ